MKELTQEDLKQPFIEGLPLEVEMRTFLIDLAYRLIKDGYEHKKDDGTIIKMKLIPSHIAFVNEQLRKELNCWMYA